MLAAGFWVKSQTCWKWWSENGAQESQLHRTGTEIREGRARPFLWMSSNIETKIQKTGIKLKGNLVGGFGHLQRETKQTNHPMLQATGSSLYQVVIQSSESSKTKLLSWSMLNWIHRGWCTSALKQVCTCCKSCPPLWPSTWRRSEQLPSHLRACPSPHGDILRNTSLTFLSRRPNVYRKTGRSIWASKRNEEMAL